MRKITIGQISFFLTLLGLIIFLAAISANFLARKQWLGDFYGVIYVMALVTLVQTQSAPVQAALVAPQAACPFAEPKSHKLWI